MSEPAAQCPLRPGEPCMACQPGGPVDCGLVYLVMTDPELRSELQRIRASRSEETAPEDASDDETVDRQPDPPPWPGG